MTKAELSAALKIAEDKSIHFIDDNGKHLEDISMFDGFGLPNFQPITCTLKQLAFLIRWQCFNMNGSIDQNNLNEIALAGKKRFMVV